MLLRWQIAGHCCDTKRRPCTYRINSLHRQAVARNTMAEVQQSTMPLFSFGVISDVQYADIPDGTSFHGVPRFYRNSLVALRRAVSTGWVPAGIQFGIHFGDILDGFQAAHGRDASEKSLSAVLDAFSIFPGPTYHMLGNHCLYNLPRQRLNERLGIPPAADGGSYYSFSPHPAWLLVVLDAYDVSLLGWPEEHPRHVQAAAILNKCNPNKEKNSPEGLVGVARRFVKFGGGVSDVQLEWLKQQLQGARARGQNVLVCSHLPLLPGTCPPACLLWNYKEVLQVLQESGVVVATMAGHTHQNGYLVDDAGIHHLVLPAVLETPPGRDAYGTVEVLQDRLLLKGVDTCMSVTVKLSAAAQQQRVVLQQQQQQQPGPSDSSTTGVTVTGECREGQPTADMFVDVADDEAVSGRRKAAAAAADDVDAVQARLQACRVQA